MYQMMHMAYQTMHDTMCTNTDKHNVTLKASAFMQSSLAWSCCHRLVRLVEYCVCQWATAVDQPPFPPVFNTTDNALDGVDVNRV